MSDERRQARIAGALYTIVAVTAPIGLMWVPGRLIVDHDATATADRIGVAGLSEPPAATARRPAASARDARRPPSAAAS